MLSFRHMAWPARSGKYNAKRATYDGHTYHSGREAAYAEELDWRVKAGELREWRRQIAIPLIVNNLTVAVYTIDFIEIHADGHQVYTEVKGFATPEWRLKWKLFQALYPHYEKQVVH